jgi:hypothetical protein
MSNFTTFISSFGSSKTGLATVGYAQRGAAGAIVVARTTTGVYELGGGAYGVEILLNAATKSLLWDTGEATPIYAVEDLLDYFNKKALINRRQTDPGTGIQTIFEENDTTIMVSGQIWEDVGATIAYSAVSNGIDRQNRMA